MHMREFLPLPSCTRVTPNCLSLNTSLTQCITPLVTKMLQLLFKLLSPTVQLTCCLAAAVVADGTFRSRPDSSLPHLNVNIECSGRCENGFNFVAPFVGDADLSDYAPL